MQPNDSCPHIISTAVLLGSHKVKTKIPVLVGDVEVIVWVVQRRYTDLILAAQVGGYSMEYEVCGSNLVRTDTTLEQVAEYVAAETAGRAEAISHFR